jgi:pantetheine-phosphate adenylyltransferase
MRFKRVCLGGTFSPIHEGHRTLLRKAFSSSEMVSIGLTSDEMARHGRTREVLDLEKRRAGLVKECSVLSAEFGSRFDIVVIRDPIGFALEGDIEAIVVSEETVPGALTINELRTGQGFEPLKVLTVPILRDENGEKLSSSSLQKTGRGRPRKVRG